MMPLAILFLSVQARFPVASSTDEVIRVPADYLTIQDAINAAAPGSVIMVSSGVYNENLVINKTLSLLGEDKTSTIIDGDGKWTVVEVKADRVALNGFTIRNSSRSQGGGGIFFDHSSQCDVSGNIITYNAPAGVTLWNNSDDNLIEGNTVSLSGIILPGWIEGYSIAIVDSNNNTLIDNTLSDSIACGIDLENANNTVVEFNTVENNVVGLRLAYSDGSIIHHNAFMNSQGSHLSIMDSYNTVWDNGTEGNYWDDYTGIDDGNESRIAGDGVGDTFLPHLGVDNCPLVRPSKPIPIAWDNNVYPISVESNSTISTFRFLQPQKKIMFNVTGPASTSGYCNLTIPRSLLRDSPWKILRNGTDITSQSTITENETHSFLYITYDHSSITNIQIVGTWVVPEFSPKMITILMLPCSTLTIILRKSGRTKLRNIAKRLIFSWRFKNHH